MGKTAHDFVSEKKDIALVRPILKWAGGKTQMLKELLPRVPSSYNRYIEPFFGGGALFFAISPSQSVIADSNPELINMYRQVAYNLDDVISNLRQYQNTEEMFYLVREQNRQEMLPASAAARTIFLNKTCFNGLYRVNKQGQFNVPYGRYKNPTICDVNALSAASNLLKKATIVCADYKDVLYEHAQPGDFVFLDPPYLPISEYSDFKRYTKEQFYLNDHIELAEIIKHLREIGCNVLLTNSNHALVHELFGEYDINIIQTKRYISSNGEKRKGEDVIVSIPAMKRLRNSLSLPDLSDQVKKYPNTRFMGSKSKLLSQIWDIASQFSFDTVTDLFAGSGIVGYMFKTKGKSVTSNDYMMMSTTFAKAMIENSTTQLSQVEAEQLVLPAKKIDTFVSDTFSGLYFSEQENQLIDILRTNISTISDPYKRAIAVSALIRACTKKRPRGIFTYVGNRYDDGRRDLRKTLQEHFIDAVQAINGAVFDNGRTNIALNCDAMSLNQVTPNMVYIDPPYYSPFSDNEYVRRYHFLEGIARNWKGVEIQKNTVTKKFKSYPTPFSSRNGATSAFDQLFERYKDSILLVSYSSNSLPTQEEMVKIMSKYKKYVDTIPIDYRYSFGNQGTRIGDNMNKVKEYLFVGY